MEETCNRLLANKRKNRMEVKCSITKKLTIEHYNRMVMSKECWNTGGQKKYWNGTPQGEDKEEDRL